MECKVCTGCKDTKELSEFTFIKNKYLAKCKKCTYIAYQRPAAIKRLKKRGGVLRSEYVPISEEVKEASRVRACKNYSQRMRANKPPRIPKREKVPFAPKPPIIKLSDILTYQELREHKNRIKREHRKKNPEQLTAQRKRYYSKAKNKPEVKIAKNIRKRLKEFLKPGTRLGSFSGMVGCTKEELLKHLESLFEPGMTWDNYGLTGWHIDHIKPLAAFDVTDKNTWSEINNFKNLKPMWASVNSDKSSYWMGVRWAKGKPVTDSK